MNPNKEISSNKENFLSRLSLIKTPGRARAKRKEEPRHRAKRIMKRNGRQKARPSDGWGRRSESEWERERAKESERDKKQRRKEKERESEREKKQREAEDEEIFTRSAESTSSRLESTESKLTATTATTLQSSCAACVRSADRMFMLVRAFTLERYMRYLSKFAMIMSLALSLSLSLSLSPSYVFVWLERCSARLHHRITPQYTGKISACARANRQKLVAYRSLSPSHSLPLLYTGQICETYFYSCFALADFPLAEPLPADCASWLLGLTGLQSAFFPWMKSQRLLFLDNVFQLLT